MALDILYESFRKVTACNSCPSSVNCKERKRERKGEFSTAKIEHMKKNVPISFLRRQTERLKRVQFSESASRSLLSFPRLSARADSR